MDKTTPIVNKLGHMGRLLSYSKGDYGRRFPNNTVFFNANIYAADGEKLWFGDLDITKDREKLVELAKELGTFYVTREMPFRFETVTTEKLQAACQGEYPDAYVFG